jgi:hypothetical protein
VRLLRLWVQEIPSAETASATAETVGPGDCERRLRVRLLGLWVQETVSGGCECTRGGV